MSTARILLAAAGAALCGCGYPGNPLPPALNIPVAVKDLVAVQRGDRILLRFTPALNTTDDLLLARLNGAVLRGGPTAGGQFNIWRWAETARDIPVGEIEFEVVEAAGERPRRSRRPAATANAAAVETSTPAAGWIDKDVLFAARTIGPTGRSSEWSVPVRLHVVAPLVAPSGVAAEGMAKGVGVHWSVGAARPGVKWRVWRRIEKTDVPVNLGTASEPNWLDPTAETGNSYIYAVQAVLDTGNGKEAESEVSEEAALRYEDVFPPEPPKGLNLVASGGGVELTWERAQEPDFAFWQVWRAEGDGPLKKLGGPLTGPSYSDHAVEGGKTYRYAVSASDAKGNESKPCEPVTVTPR